MGSFFHEWRRKAGCNPDRHRHSKNASFRVATCLMYLAGGVYLLYEQSSFGVMLKGKEESDLRFVYYPLTVTLGTICEFFNLGGAFLVIYFSFAPIGTLLILLGIRMLWGHLFRSPN